MQHLFTTISIVYVAALAGSEILGRRFDKLTLSRSIIGCLGGLTLLFIPWFERDSYSFPELTAAAGGLLLWVSGRTLASSLRKNSGQE